MLRDGSSRGLAAVNDGFAVAGKFFEGRAFNFGIYFVLLEKTNSASKKNAFKVLVQIMPSSLLSWVAIRGACCEGT